MVGFVSKQEKSLRYRGLTNIKRLDFATVVTNSLKNLLDFRHEAIMVDGGGKLDDSEMTSTLCQILITSTAF